MGQISLRWVMVIFSIVQVAVACTVVWYIGWTYSQRTVNGLSNTLRAATLNYASTSVATILNRPILAAYALQEMIESKVQTRGLDMGRLDVLTNDTFITDCTAILRSYRGLSKVGIITATGALAGVAQTPATDKTNTTLYYYVADNSTGWGFSVWLPDPQRPLPVSVNSNIYRSISNASVSPPVYVQALPFYYMPTIAEVQYWSGASPGNTSKISTFQNLSAFTGGCQDPRGGCSYQSRNFTNFTDLDQYKAAANASGQAKWFQNPPTAATVNSGGVEATLLLG
jgi:hypothetical protein